MMTYVPIDERLEDLRERILRAFPEQFDVTEQSFLGLGGLGCDMYQLVWLAMRQEPTLQGVFTANAVARVVEELLGRCERTLADYAEMDAWMEAEHAEGANCE